MGVSLLILMKEYRWAIDNNVIVWERCLFIAQLTPLHQLSSSSFHFYFLQSKSCIKQNIQMDEVTFLLLKIMNYQTIYSLHIFF